MKDTVQIRRVLRLYIYAGTHLCGHLHRAVTQRQTLIGQRNDKIPLIILRARTRNIPLCLESLEQGRECPRIQKQLLSELLNT